MKINKVTNLPGAYSHNCFVTYQFKWAKENVSSTKYFPGKNSNPELQHSKVHSIDMITEQVVDELCHGRASFKVFAFPMDESNNIKHMTDPLLVERLQMKLNKKAEKAYFKALNQLKIPKDVVEVVQLAENVGNHALSQQQRMDNMAKLADNMSVQFDKDLKQAYQKHKKQFAKDMRDVQDSSDSDGPTNSMGVTPKQTTEVAQSSGCCVTF